MAIPKTTPQPMPQVTMRVVAARVAAVSPAPSVRPMIACPAMAIESWANARKVQIRAAMVCASICASPIRVASEAVMSSVACRLTVRMNRAKPAPPAERSPAGSGRSEVPCRRAARTTRTR